MFARSTSSSSSSSGSSKQTQQQQQPMVSSSSSMVGIFSEEAAETFRMMLQRGAIEFVNHLYAYLRQKHPHEDQPTKRRDCFRVWEKMTDESLRRREAEKLTERFPFLPKIYKIVASKYVKRLYDFLTEDRYVVKFSLPEFTLFYHRFICALGQYKSVLEGDFVRSDFEESRQMQVRDAIRDAMQTCLVNNLRVLDKSLPPRPMPSSSSSSSSALLSSDGEVVGKSTVHWADVAPKTASPASHSFHDDEEPHQDDYQNDDNDDDDDDKMHDTHDTHDTHDERQLPAPIEPVPISKVDKSPLSSSSSSSKKSQPGNGFDWQALDVPASDHTKTPRPSVNVRSAPPTYRTQTPKSGMSHIPPTPSTVERFLNTPAELALTPHSPSPALSSSAELLQL